MNSNIILKFGAAVLTLSAYMHPAYAADAGSSSSIPPNISTFQQLDELRSQNALLSEAVKNAELKTKLDGNAVAGITPGANLKVPGTANVLLVSSRMNDLTALIALPNGGQVKARVGTRIAGIGTVKSISTNEVVVSHGKELISLPFASDTGSLPTGVR